MNTQLYTKRLQSSTIHLPPPCHQHLCPLPSNCPRANRPVGSSTCQCSNQPSTSTTASSCKPSNSAAVSAYQPTRLTKVDSTTSVVFSPAHQTSKKSRLRAGTSLVAHAKRGPQPDESLPDDGDDDIFESRMKPFGPASEYEDDLALEGGEDSDAEIFDDGEDDEGDFDEQLGELDDDEEEAEAEEGTTDDEEEEGLESEDEASEGEEEQSKQELPYQTEEISFKEFAKRGELAPFSAVPARVDVPTQEEIDSVIPRDGSKDVVIPEGAQAALNRQGYQAFQMGKIEFLVAETPDGKLDLKDSFIFDEGYEMYARPEVSGELPELPIMLQPIPWVERKSGDFLKQKAPYSQMKKVYFVGVQSLRPYRMALDQVFKFESASRVLSREAVRTVGNPVDPILRIRADGITIEDSGQIPTPSQMLQQGDIQLKEETEEEKLARIQEMEEKAEELDRLDEQPDVPASDMM